MDASINLRPDDDIETRIIIKITGTAVTVIVAITVAITGATLDITYLLLRLRSLP